jgi:signal transduction histidine kinase
VTADLTRPLGLGLAHAAVAAVAIAFGAVPFDFPIWGIIGLEAGLTVAVLVGISRRQFRANEAQSRLLRERDLTVRQERDRLQLLADRQAAARDIHDVLAHSLGGLVIQLDAVEALLEAGDVDGAARRVSDARALAASGLDDARRAVVALRDEPTPNDAVPVVTEPLASSLGALIDAHRAFGGTAEFTMAGEERPLDAPAATALRRALQESLSNARKHATGEPVSVRLVWTGTDVTLTVENRMNDLLVARQAGAGAGARTGAETGAVAQTGAVARTGAETGAVAQAGAVAAAGARARAGTGMLASTGGGHGLSGMRERFAELPNGGTVRAEADGSRFVVVAEAKLA